MVESLQLVSSISGMYMRTLVRSAAQIVALVLSYAQVLQLALKAVALACAQECLASSEVR